MPDIEEAASVNSLIDLSELVKIRDFPKEGVFFGVFYRNPALLHLRVLLLPLIVLLQNTHTTLALN